MHSQHFSSSIHAHFSSSHQKPCARLSSVQYAFSKVTARTHSPFVHGVGDLIVSQSVSSCLFVVWSSGVMYFVTDAWHPVQVNSTYLQGSCLAESAAQNISSATSQAIGSALAPKYGANACSNITSSGMDVTPAFWHASP